MNFIKRYWFGGILALIVCCFLLLFVLLIISPKQDARGRGFVKCTQTLISSLSECDRKIFCSIKAISQNTLCDIAVVVDGFQLWIDNKQAKPWSNYLFEPDVIEDSFFDKEAIEDYLKNNPNVKDEMIRLNKLRKELEDEEYSQTINKEMLPE